MSSAPSRFAINWSLGALKGDKNITAIRFPLGWDSRVGPVFAWYEQLPDTKFTCMQHRKEHEGPFYHEFLCVKLANGKFCRFERFGDPNARTDALTEQGSVAHDVAEILPAERLATLDKTSDVVEEITFPRQLDLMDVLEICYNIQQDKRTRTYTLQRYNCYFFCWCILLILTRKLALWDSVLSVTVWDQAIQQLESDLSKAAPTDQDSLVFLLCRWLAPNTSRPEGYVIRALCDELSGTRASILKNLCRQLELTLWQYDWPVVVQGELSNAEKVASWAERQTPISAVPNLMQYAAESYKEVPGLESKPKRKSKLAWLRKVVAMFTTTSINDVPKAVEHSPIDEASVQPKLKELLTSSATGSSAQHNLEAMMHILETDRSKETEWDKVWTLSVGDLLNKYLAPLVIHYLLAHESKSLRVTYPLEKSREDAEQEMGVSQFQQAVQARIASHASRVDRVRLGSDSQIQTDVKETVKRVYGLMTTGASEKNVLGGLESGLESSPHT